MKYLIYISSATALMTQAELSALLPQIRDRNKSLHVTGLLIYCEGTFIQVLEGKADTVTKIFKTIAADPRHRNVIKLAEGTLETRNFPEWSMAFTAVNPEECKMLEGYINPHSKNFIKSDTPHVAITILKTFAASNKLGEF
jgi:hypothetical protein